MSFLLAIGFAAMSGIALNERFRRKATEYMRERLPVADTDEDVLGVLETSGAKIAPRLLEAAEIYRDDASWRHDPYEHTPDVAAWDLLLKDLTMETGGEAALEVLRQWLMRGYHVTIAESVLIVEYFDTAEWRAKARELITASMLERVDDTL